MPHQCTNCGRTFADGSKEMLSGCPDCGGNKFQFRPAGAGDPSTADDAATESDPSPSPADAARTERTEPTRSDAATEPVADRAAPAERSRSTPADGDPSATTPPAATDAGEDGAQASARSETVSEDEIAAAAPEPGEPSATADAGAETAPDAADGDTEPADPNLDALRQKLNDQFESIRIVSPGQYELNLMELYDREEYIISLREDGRYVIEMPESWDDR